MSVNLSYVLCMMVIGLALQLCVIMGAAGIGQEDVKVSGTPHVGITNGSFTFYERSR